MCYLIIVNSKNLARRFCKLFQPTSSINLNSTTYIINSWFSKHYFILRRFSFSSRSALGFDFLSMLSPTSHAAAKSTVTARPTVEIQRNPVVELPLLNLHSYQFLHEKRRINSIALVALSKAASAKEIFFSRTTRYYFVKFRSTVSHYYS